MDEQPEKETDMASIAAARERRVQEWDEVHKVVPWGSVPDRNFEKFVAQNWGVGPPVVATAVPRFLDLGCGAGAQAIWLAEQGYKVHAIDGSLAALDRLSERRRRLAVATADRIIGFNIDLSQIREGEFRDQCFDCALDVCCLQHLAEDDAVAVAQKARRWLKPGGWFWSKQAIPPFDHTLNRVSFIRMATMESLRRMFVGYAFVQMDMVREVVRGDKNLWSVIVRAQVGL
jgi:SAM-dependent methyltransferase